jgi:5-methylcytosine-specific restriction endonuclease McrA
LQYRDYLLPFHWKRSRDLAIVRADHQCGLCSSRNALDVHHRTYERLGFERPADVMALCADCHHDHHRALVLRAIRGDRARAIGSGGR